MGLFDRLRKGAKKKKVKAKAKKNKRQREREKRRRRLRKKKAAVGEFVDDVSEFAGATRLGGGFMALRSGAERTAKSGKRGLDALESGARAADRGLDRLGVEPPEEDAFVSDEPMFGPTAGGDMEPMFEPPDDDEFRI